MNQNQEDAKLLTLIQWEQLVGNSLVTIENMKSLQVTSERQSQVVQYKENRMPEWTMETLIRQLRGIKGIRSEANYSLDPNEFFQQKSVTQEEPRRISPKMVELSTIKQDEAGNSLDFNFFKSIESSSLIIPPVEKKIDFNQ